jgi:hypothetical protein
MRGPYARGNNKLMKGKSTKGNKRNAIEREDQCKDRLK